MQGDVPRPFNHALHPAFQGVAGQPSEIDDLLPLRGVARIHAGAGSQAVAQGKSDIVGAANVEQAVKIFQKRIFPVIFQHPFGQHGATA